jgi:hypothetical protein
MKKVIILFAILFALGMSNVKAQGYDGKGSLMLGPTIGLSWGAAFGATVDYGLNDKWSLGGDLMYTSYSSIGSDYTLIGVLAAASYHFDFLGDGWDPYLKGGLGYMNWSVSGIGIAPSAFGIALQGGARYYLKDNLALRASLGFPYYIGVGVDFKL